MNNRGKEGADTSGGLEKRRQIPPNTWPKFLLPCENHRRNATAMRLETYSIYKHSNNKIRKWKEEYLVIKIK